MLPVPLCPSAWLREWKAPLLTHRHLHEYSHTHVTTQNTLTTPNWPCSNPHQTSQAHLRLISLRGFGTRGIAFRDIYMCTLSCLLAPTHPPTHTWAPKPPPTDNALLRIATASWPRRPTMCWLHLEVGRSSVLTGAAWGLQAKPPHPAWGHPRVLCALLQGFQDLPIPLNPFFLSPSVVCFYGF